MLYVISSPIHLFKLFNLLQKKSETNAKNRAGKEYEHCGGSRPHGLYFQDKVQVNHNWQFVVIL